MMNVLKIIETSNADDISAFLTTSIISHSYEVESTHSVVSLWDDMRNNVMPAGDLEFVSSLLAMGRIMDYKIEIEGFDILKNVISDIKRNLESKNIVTENLQKDLVSAIITASTISKSERVETVREIVSMWEQVRDGLPIENDLDTIAAILTTGRLMELKFRVDGLPAILDIFKGIKVELTQQTKDREITQGDLAAAFITSAYIEISPRVEKMRDMVKTWHVLAGQTPVVSHWDYIASILSTGRIRDMDALHIQGHEGLASVSETIRAQMREVVGE